MKWDKISEDVFYPRQNEFVEISKSDIDSLIKAAEENPRERARYCTHSSTEDDVHEMVIYHKEGTYIRPHKHIGKPESFFLIDGEVDVVIFDEEGNPIKFLNLGGYKCGKPFYYRLPESIYHTQIFKSNTLFHEVTKGPFEKNDTVFPSWAPPDDKHHLVNEYIRQLNLQLELLTH